jgi:hypothetical protein
MCNCRRFTLIAALFLLLSAWAHARSLDTEQNREQKHSGQGYVFFGPSALVLDGHTTGTLHIGAGGESLIYKGLGIGAEVGYFSPWRDIGNGLGLISVDGSYHFARNRKVSPFLTGGYSMAIRNGHANLLNFGGGVNLWLRRRLGLRLEFRNHMDRSSHYFMSGRIGLSFR